MTVDLPDAIRREGSPGTVHGKIIAHATRAFAIQSLICEIQQIRSWGLCPDFLWSLLALATFMRLSLNESRTRGSFLAPRAGNPGRPLRFRPRYALANLGHPSYSLGLCYDTDPEGTTEFFISLERA
jgi:hypothetical protein